MDRRGGNRAGGSKAIHRLVVALPLLLLSACITTRIHTAQEWYYQKRFDDAERHILLDEIPSRDRLLALLEKGMALQAAGSYLESAEAWREAETLMEKQDLFRVGEQALSLILDQSFLAYQPAPYEKPFLHALLAVDYILLGNHAAARVESLKALDHLDDRESVVGPMAFVRFVAALAFECSGDANDAYIEYKKIHATGETGGIVLPELIRLSAQLGFEDECTRYRAEFADSEQPGKKSVPALLLLGRSPKKIPSEIDLGDGYKMVVPMFQSRSSSIQPGRGIAGGDTDRHPSRPLTSVEKLAANFSGKLVARELLKEILRHKAKKRLVEKVGDKVGSTTGDILKTVFFFAQEADLRTWSSLPAEVHLLRVPADTGLPTGDPPGRESCPVVLLRAW